MTVTLLRLLGRLPLAWLHRIGALLGWLVYLGSPVYAKRMRENLTSSGIYARSRELEGALRACVAQTGKGVTEIAKVWFDAVPAVEALVRCEGWDAIEQARREGRGMLFLTPHLGCFEIAAFYVAQRMPLTVLYRPPRQRWLEPLMVQGRKRGQAQVAPASLRGVRLLYKALQRGEAVGILPDQAPQVGEGAWADFFGRPAYTITLVRRLRKQTGAAVILTFAERLAEGRGYVLRFERCDAAGESEAALNQATERLVHACPTQYLWSYNRYKTPKGAVAPSGASGERAPPPTPPQRLGGE